jgi:hypothetical protein
VQQYLYFTICPNVLNRGNFALHKNQFFHPGMWRVWVRRGGCIGSWWGNRRERDHWGDLGVDGRNNIRMDVEEVGCGYMDWIGLAQDRDMWRTLVSAVMNLRVP